MKPPTSPSPVLSPFRHGNIRRFLAFRVFFNARFYYPVFTVLFLDLGLTLEQFLLLNTVWAATIILFEVPSGAMADAIGRRRLVIIAAICMLLEMALLAFVPIGAGGWVFGLLLLNRVISGFAEAMSSGADEALAYDTLKAAREEAFWPQVLDWQMRLQSGGFVVAMLLGGVLYDSVAVNHVLAWLGVNLSFSPETTLRFPVYLCLVTAVGALFCALGMRDPQPTGGEIAPTLTRASKNILDVARWTVRTPAVLLLIAVAVTFDSTARTMITLASEYYRNIGLPGYLFGFVGAFSGIIGLFTPYVARQMATRLSPWQNAVAVALVLGGALIGMSLTIPIWGVIPVFGIGITLTLVSFFSSHYLNRLVVDSSHRATVLSIRSLAINLAYGVAGLIYMGVTTVLREDAPAVPRMVGEESPVFAEVMQWTPLYYPATLVVLGVFIAFIRRRYRANSIQW